MSDFLRKKFDLVLCGALFVSAWIWAQNVGKVADLDRFDEPAFYISKALSLFRNPSAVWDVASGPLYVLNYFFLSFIEEDPLRLYFLNAKILVSLLPLAFFLWLRSGGIGRFAAYLGGVMVLLFAPLVLQNRFPVHFAMLVALIGMATSAIFRVHFQRLQFLTVTFFLVALVRPEYLISFVSLYGLAIYFAFKQFKSASPRQFWSLFFFVLVNGIFLSGMLSNISSERAIYNFQQYNYLRIIDHNHIAIPPGHMDSAKYFKDVYGNPDSVVEAIVNNPKEFGRHIGYESVNLLKNLGQLFATFLFLAQTKFLFCCLALGTFLFWLSRREENGRKKYHLRITDKNYFFLMMIAFGLPPLVSGVIIGNEPRYLFPLVFVIIAGAAIRIPLASSRATLALAALGLISTLILLPTSLRAHPALAKWRGNKVVPFASSLNQSALAEVLMLRALRIEEQKRVLTLRGDQYHFVSRYAEIFQICANHAESCTDANAPSESLADIVEHQRINVISFYSDFQFSIESIPHGRLRSEIAGIIENPEKIGFSRVELPCSYGEVFIKSELIDVQKINRAYSEVRNQIYCI